MIWPRTDRSVQPVEVEYAAITGLNWNCLSQHYVSDIRSALILVA